jgi:hypothetical protein
MNDKQQLKKHIYRICACQEFGISTTSIKDQPVTKIISFIHIEDLHKLIFITAHQTFSFGFHW